MVCELKGERKKRGAAALSRWVVGSRCRLISGRRDLGWGGVRALLDCACFFLLQRVQKPGSVARENGVGLC